MHINVNVYMFERTCKRLRERLVPLIQLGTLLCALQLSLNDHQLTSHLRTHRPDHGRITSLYLWPIKERKVHFLHIKQKRFNKKENEKTKNNTTRQNNNTKGTENKTKPQDKKIKTKRKHKTIKTRQNKNKNPRQNKNMK